MAWVSNGVNGIMSNKLKTRGKYFKFANLESIFMNDMKKFLYFVINKESIIEKTYSFENLPTPLFFKEGNSSLL